MRALERVREEDVLATWLAGELESRRFGADVRRALAVVGAGEELVARPDLADEEQNRLRREVFRLFRGEYVGASLDGLAWHRVALEPDEVLALLYIDWDFWNETSGGTRRATDAVPRLRERGEEPGYRELAAHAAAFAPLIAVRAASGERIVLVEGHVRLTALAFCPEQIPRPLEILLGEGEPVRRFGCY